MVVVAYLAHAVHGLKPVLAALGLAVDLRERLERAGKVAAGLLDGVDLPQRPQRIVGLACEVVIFAVSRLGLVHLAYGLVAQRQVEQGRLYVLAVRVQRGQPGIGLGGLQVFLLVVIGVAQAEQGHRVLLGVLIILGEALEHGGGVLHVARLEISLAQVELRVLYGAVVDIIDAELLELFNSPGIILLLEEAAAQAEQGLAGNLVLRRADDQHGEPGGEVHARVAVEDGFGQVESVVHFGSVRIIGGGQPYLLEGLGVLVEAVAHLREPEQSQRQLLALGIAGKDVLVSRDRVIVLLGAEPGVGYLEIGRLGFRGLGVPGRYLAPGLHGLAVIAELVKREAGAV